MQQGMDILVATPATVCDASLAIAATRAGARGVLDLEYTRDSAAAEREIARLERFAGGPYGLKLGPEAGPLVERLLADPPPGAAFVILAGGPGADFGRWIEGFRRRNIQTLVETIDWDEILGAERLRADGIVLKGHESGGRVGQETAFVLLQRWNAHFAGGEANRLPAWVQGGIGLNSAAACAVGGAAGVVLDAQSLLARESPLGEVHRRLLQAMDGSETVCVGGRLGAPYRILHRPGSPFIAELAEEEERIQSALEDPAERREAWRETIRRLVGPRPDQDVWPLGQDAALAGPLAGRHVTVGGIVAAVRQAVARNVRSARHARPLAEGAPLAASHGTRYPIVQGPMTRVSDTAEFALAVAEAGALPLLAVAMLRGPALRELLSETRSLLGERSWGVGILGFLPPEVREEQIAAVLANRPPLALIAGGRPDQARQLEAAGTATYLHVPSPHLLQMYLREGAKRFVFEGRECGGHVGPRSSFVLWEQMIGVLLEHLGAAGQAEGFHVLLAGGIHDGLSAAMAAALAAPLAERGVAVGVLMGTAYLFTEEAVAARAIVPRFQREAVACLDTVLLETGPGHAIRCLRSPYYDTFEAEKRRLRAAGRSPDEIVKALEWMNLGRLRAASKGLDRAADGDGAAKLAELPEDEQFARGMYMIGQVGALRHGVVRMSDLHAEVSEGGTRRLEAAPGGPVAEESPPSPCDVAIVGMSCFFPKADGVSAYWENILARVDAVTEVPPSHWDWRLYYDPDPQARDKSISKWGGFLGDVPFDALSYGITPKSMSSIEPLHLMLLEGVRRALADAGYAQRPFNRERTAAVLGIGGGGSPMAVYYGLRTCLPLIDTLPDLPITAREIIDRSGPRLPEWTEDSFPGILMNVAVGRVANRFDFGGTNMAIDAACASSLAALGVCVRELEQGTADVAVAMGADTVQTPYSYVAFSKTWALSPKGRCRPFDAAADGIALSEGIGVVVLKRLADAQRDGDRIYAVIKGVGTSSDGKDKGLTAPNSAGQLRALRRAYAKAGISPARLGLVEAHGTGTVMGDLTEGQSLQTLLREAGAAERACALGSVKSMIGHAKCAAGMAGLIKTAQALHRKVLPPTLVEDPNPKLEFGRSPLYLNTEVRPWVHGRPAPRTAGVSAFGFGGTNVHVVLEEYTGEYREAPPPGSDRWPAELCVFRRPSREALVEAVTQCAEALRNGARPALADLAASLWQACARDSGQPTLAVVAGSLDELGERLAAATEKLRGPEDWWHDPRGIYFALDPAAQRGKVAVLFPGQGSQYPNMLAQTAAAFPEVRLALDRAEETLAGTLDRPLGSYVYPPSEFTPDGQRDAEQRLAQTDVAQPAIGAASLGMFRLLRALGVEADFFAGHSYGEYAALCAAGALAEDELIRLSHLRGRLIRDAAGESPGTMAAAAADRQTVAEAVEGMEGVTLANLNSPKQTVLSGPEPAIQAALERLAAAGVRGQKLPVACAFHSPLVAPAGRPLADALRDFGFSSPRRPVYSNTTARPHAEDPAEIVRVLGDHLTSPVRFQESIEAMYDAGARIFIEAGPQRVLTGLVRDVLQDRPHLAVASDLRGAPGIVQLQQLLGQLLVAGLPLELERLFRGRAVKTFDLARLKDETGAVRHPPMTYLVNGVRCRLADGPEPLLMGQATAGLPPGEASSAPQPRVPQPRSQPVSSTQSQSNLQAMTSPGSRRPPEPPTGILGSQAAPPAASPAPADETAAVMMRYHQLMDRFLEDQRSVMLAYLQGAGGAAAVESAPLSVPAPAHAAHGANGEGGAGRVFYESAAAPPSGNGHGTPAAQPPAGPPALDMETLTARLLDLVSQRTGYPKEMLGLDLDLEGNLGIDSIKRVEILGGLAESINGQGAGLESKLELEKLTGIGTLRGILKYLEESLFNAPADAAQSPGSPPTAKAPPSAPDAQNGASAPKSLEVQRALVELVDAPLSGRGAMLVPSGAIVLTDDGRGVAAELAGRLEDFGQTSVLVRMARGSSQNGHTHWAAADLTDPQAVEDLAARIRAKVGPVAGLVHLLPLAEPPRGENHALRMRREVKSLYLLARALGPELRQAGRDGGAVLLAATGMGGGLGFGDGPLPETFFAGQGGVAGFAKCLAQEWPEVLVRAVDFDAGRDPAEIAECLLAELGDRHGPQEAGYQGPRRVTWQPVAAPLEADPDLPPPLSPQSTVLVTGGARGITSEIVAQLAGRYQPTIVLVGRSPLPERDESPETSGLAAPAEIKAALIARTKREGLQPQPAEIEARYRRLAGDREIRKTLQRIRAVGGRAEYHSLDVRDAAAVQALIEDVEERLGSIEGVIHAAGVIEDKLVRDKTPESFERVFSTKADSALILAQSLRPERLKFFAMFASIASRFGNAGQADYAAANEVLSKLAADLDRRWPGRVFAVAWGPWSGLGMVADLEKHLRARGIAMIDPEAGARFMLDELAFGRKGQTEVLIAGGAEHLVRPAARSPRPEEAALIS